MHYVGLAYFTPDRFAELSPEEVKALRRSAKIEHMPKHAAEFHALHAILNVSQAMPRGVAGDRAEAALTCARNRVAMLRAAAV